MQETTHYIVKVSPGLEYECIAPFDSLYAIGDRVTIQCDRFTDIGTIIRKLELPTEQELKRSPHFANTEDNTNNLPKHEVIKPNIEYYASEDDEQKCIDNKKTAEDCLITAIGMAKEEALEMKFIDTHCSLDKKLIIFLFTAEGRVDFRQLLRKLSDSIHTRVELRQVGVRDETTIIGGISPCGRELCCSSFLKKFVSINVRMAKEQNLSLNPSNISGVCGRLKCCLAYEYQYYKQANAIEKAKKLAEQTNNNDGKPQKNNQKNNPKNNAPQVKKCGCCKNGNCNPAPVNNKKNNDRGNNMPRRK